MLNHNRTFGVEIEFADMGSNASQFQGAHVRDLLDYLGSNGMNVYTFDEYQGYGGYTHGYIDKWKLVSDGSCGWEMVSPVLQGLAGVDEVKEMARLMADYGCTITRRCGLHVHHGAGDFTAENLKNLRLLYATHQFAVSRLFPESRRNNGFCEPSDYAQLKASIYHASWDEYDRRPSLPFLGRHRTFSNEFDWYQACMTGNVKPFASASPSDFLSQPAGAGMGRYSTLNMESWYRYSTVEFRQHHGTLNGSKIANWIVVTQAFVERARMRSYEPIPQMVNSSESAERSLIKGLHLEDRQLRQTDPQYMGTWMALQRMIRRAKSAGYYDNGGHLPPRYFVESSPDVQSQSMVRASRGDARSPRQIVADNARDGWALEVAGTLLVNNGIADRQVQRRNQSANW
jgi:hypothetical protein